MPSAAVDYSRDFGRRHVRVPGGNVFLRMAGSGPGVMLLHGFPETNLAWKRVAPALVAEFTVVVPDLPGYGDSTLRDELGQQDRVSKRDMARVLANAMAELGIARFAVAGHDRGGRVAYRLALDRPDLVSALGVLDVVPILDMAERLTYASARQMAHWLWLSQPSTVPETLIQHDVERYLHYILESWGGAKWIEPAVVADYLRCLRKPDVIRAMGAEYRADQQDLDHDKADRDASRRIACPVLAMWAAGGLVEQFGDPAGIWRQWADRVATQSLPGDHFMMEESPDAIARALHTFLRTSI